jgi:hypothetical protein
VRTAELQHRSQRQSRWVSADSGSAPAAYWQGRVRGQALTQHNARHQVRDANANARRTLCNQCHHFALPWSCAPACAAQSLRCRAHQPDLLALPTPVPFAGSAAFEVTGQTCHHATTADSASDSDLEAYFDRRVQLPVPVHFTAEARVRAESIQASILNMNPNIRWDDIAGLADAKRLVKEAVVHPSKYPQLFTGVRTDLIACMSAKN